MQFVLCGCKSSDVNGWASWLRHDCPLTISIKNSKNDICFLNRKHISKRSDFNMKGSPLTIGTYAKRRIFIILLLYLDKKIGIWYTVIRWVCGSCLVMCRFTMPCAFGFFWMHCWQHAIYVAAAWSVSYCLGVWCNGNMPVSKTVLEGSSPSTPATVKSLEITFLMWFPSSFFSRIF